MPRPIPRLRLECSRCDRPDEIEGTSLEELLGEPISLRSVGSLYGELRCDNCRSLEIRILDDNGRLLIDPANLTRCNSCEEVIPLPRIQAAPGTKRCVTCSSKPRPPQPRHPQPPPDMQTCPRCGASTVVRQNRNDKNLFLGCMRFPRCRWTSPL
jgi:hypothetical protein